MADYHIYLHSNESENGSKTTPFSARSSSESNGNFAPSKVASGISSAKAYASGSQGAGSTGVAALAKAVPWLAVIYAVAKVIDYVVDTGFTHAEDYTGMYKYSVGYNNFKTHLSHVLNPIGFGFSVIHKNKQIEKQNKEITQQNKLIGNSILKDFNIGV